MRSYLSAPPQTFCFCTTSVQSGSHRQTRQRYMMLHRQIRNSPTHGQIEDGARLDLSCQIAVRHNAASLGIGPSDWSRDGGAIYERRPTLFPRCLRPREGPRSDLPPPKSLRPSPRRSSSPIRKLTILASLLALRDGFNPRVVNFPLFVSKRLCMRKKKNTFILRINTIISIIGWVVWVGVGARGLEALRGYSPSGAGGRR